MDTNSTLDRTITKVLSQAEGDMISQIDSAYEQAVSNLQSSRSSVEADYNRIIEGANTSINRFNSPFLNFFYNL
ncbi:MAG: hypothetical protein HMLIMOIP_002249 [Candidatus Nitrosomirales archaeon]|jgi:hypothetical protein